MQKEQLSSQCRAWLNEGVVEESKALVWTNNPVFVAKKNGAIRVCIDCTPANKVTVDFDWPLPRLQDLRHRLGGAIWFSRMDMKDAFFRIRVPKKWRHLTAFESGGRRFQFTKMPFGLKTAPATFQRYMDHALAEHFPYCFWYMDDVLTYATTLAALRRKTQAVRRSIMKSGLTINEGKSEYDRQGLLFAGMWLYSRGVGPNHEKIREVMETPVPRTKVEKQSALGLVSYLRDHIPLASLLTAHLTSNVDLEPETLRKLWTHLLHHISVAFTTLSGWKEDEDAYLYTDSSNYATAAVLIQNGRIISLASRKFTQAETRYSATDREHLSLKLAAEKMRMFLHRRKGVTHIANDHMALLNRDVSRMSPRQARTNQVVKTWITNLSHVKGKNNPADFFSRWSIETGGSICTLRV